MLSFGHAHADWAEELALHILEFIGTEVAIGGIFAADVLVMLGEYDRAIEALREFARIGGYWRIGIEFNSNLAPLHDRADYQAIIQSLHEHADAERAKLREMEKPEDTCRASFDYPRQMQ